MLFRSNHEAEQHINAQEAEFGADGNRVFRDTEATAAPTIREMYEQYKPVVTAAISEDAAYRNACGHSDRENAVIEGNAAVRRAVLGSKDMELIRLYSDVPEFRQRLHREVIDETYPKLHELLRPLSQEDIDSIVYEVVNAKAASAENKNKKAPKTISRKRKSIQN